MNSRERVMRALFFEEPDRVPFNFWMDRRLMEQFQDRFGVGEGWRVKHYGADVVETFYNLPFPCGEMIEESGTSWLVEPLIKDWTEVESIELPDPNLDSVYDIIERDIDLYPDSAVFVDSMGVLTAAHGMRGYDNLFTDVLDYPKEVKSLFSRITEVMVDAAERACEMDITALYVMDDVCYSNGPMMSLPMLEEMVLDFNAQQMKVAKKADIPVAVHCCGKVTNVIDALVDRGANAINPLQPHLHDFEAFKKKYHGTLAVYGALDNTHIIPLGKPEDVRNHVFDTFDKLGEGGGLIFSTHDIPVQTPEENIEAMVEAIKQCTY